MKKQIKSLAVGISCILLALALCLPVFAERQLDYVTDAAYVLTDEQRLSLEQEAESISEQYQCDMYILTLDDFAAYTNASDIDTAAKQIFEEYDLGFGSDKSGVLLLLSMAERDYALIAHGYGNTAFTDYGKDKLAEAFLDDFSCDDWNNGFTDYLDNSASMLESAREGNPLDVQSDPMIGLVGLLIALVLGCAIAGIICFFLRLTMRSVATGAEADAYIPSESIAFTRREDRFTHTTEVRTKIEKKSSSSGGTTIDSGGFSSNSGKF